MSAVIFIFVFIAVEIYTKFDYIIVFVVVIM